MLTLGLNLGEVTLSRAKGGGFFNGLDLDFVANRYALNGPYSAAFPAGWSFSRTGAGTAETSGGVIVPFGTGVPRITDRGLLVEEARTNLLLDSQSLNSGWWARNNAAFTANQALGPDGTMSAGLLVDNAVTGEHFVVQTPSIVGSTTYTQTWIVKYLNHRYVGVGWFSIFNSIGVPARSAIFDLVAGTVSLPPTADIGAVASIRALADGWFALRISAPSGAGATSATCALRLMNGNDWNTSSVTYAGTGTGIYVWNGQMEAGAFPTSPIITTGAPATRGADVSSVNMTLPPEGTIVVEYAAPIAGNPSRAYAVMVDDTGNDRLAIRASEPSNFGPNAVVGDGTTLTNFNFGVPTAHRERTRLAFAYSTLTARAAYSQNGLLATASRQLATSALSSGRLAIGQAGDGTNSANTEIRRVRLLPYSASDDEARALASPANDWTDLSSYLASLDDALMLDFADPDWMRTTPGGPTQPLAIGDNIGLTLSRRLAGQNDLLSRYLAGQPELANPAGGTNRSTGTGTASQSGGAVTLTGTNSSNLGRYDFPISTVAGRLYRVDFTIAGEFSFCGIWQNAGFSSVISGTTAGRGAGPHTIFFVAVGSTSFFGAQNVLTGGTTTLSGFTIKEVSRTAATQSFANLQPRWQGYGGARFDGLDDVLLTGYRAGAGANFIVAKARIQAAVSSGPVVGLAGLRTNAGGRLFLGVRQTGGVACGGVGVQNQDTIFGGSSILGREVVVGITQDGTTVRLFADGQQVYSGPQSGAVATTVPLMVGGINTEGTAGFFTSSDVSRLVAGQSADASAFIDLARFRQIASQL